MLKNDGTPQNTLFTGDNLFILRGINSQSVDLIYLDPPFNSKRTYSAPMGTKAQGASFKDIWTWDDINESYLELLIKDNPDLVDFIQVAGRIHSKAMMAYLTYMTQRIIEMHRILKDTGSFYLHCDPTASHYLKQLLDYIFGKNNFITEIIWSYSWGSRTTKRWNKKHDVILMYVKSDDYYFNALEVLEKRRPEVLRRLETGVKSATMAADKSITEDKTLALPTDVWLIPTINAMAKERTGYPTQKPLELMYRIIKASCPEGGVVLDPFCGCATTCVAAQQLGRKWIGIDIEEKAAELLIERLSDDAGLFQDFIHRTDIPMRTDVIYQPPTDKNIKETLYADQKGNCNGCQQYFEMRHFEVDHIVPKSKGGGDYLENYQLLCSSCNRIKGNRPMEYLRMKIDAIKEILKHKLRFGE